MNNSENFVELDQKKGIIAIITDHNDYFRNETVARLLNELILNKVEGKLNIDFKKILDNFYFVFTGGTFHRIFNAADYREGLPLLKDEVKNWLKERTIQLPSFEHGGVALLSYLIIHEKVKTIWSFQSPDSPHHIVSQNNVLRLMSNVKGTRRLVNSRSVIDWLENDHYKKDLDDLQKNQLKSLELKTKVSIPIKMAQDSKWKIEPPLPLCAPAKNKTIAFIVRDKHASHFVEDFFGTYEKDILNNFNHILITESSCTEKITQHKELRNSLDQPVKIISCLPVGQGGLIEIAIQILFGDCDTVILYDNLGYEKEDLQESKSNKDTRELEDDAIRRLGYLEMLSFNYQIILSACKINQNVLVKRTKGEAWEWAEKLTKTKESGTEEIVLTIIIDKESREEEMKLLNELFGLIKSIEENYPGIKIQPHFKKGSIEIELTFSISIPFEQFFEQFFEKFSEQFLDRIVEGSLFGWIARHKIKYLFKRIGDKCRANIINHCKDEKIKFTKAKLTKLKEFSGIKIIDENGKEIILYCDEEGNIKTSNNSDSMHIEERV